MRAIPTVLTALAALTLGFALPLSAVAGEDADADASRFLQSCQCRAVDDTALSRLRGGFDDGRGLIASIGLERLTVVNGVVVSSVNLQISDLSKVSAQQAQQLQTTLATLGLVNGVGNAPGAAQGLQAGTTVIQNTLNNQAIRNTTVLNVSTNSQQFVRDTNLQSTLRDALTLPQAGR